MTGSATLYVRPNVLRDLRPGHLPCSREQFVQPCCRENFRERETCRFSELFHWPCTTFIHTTHNYLRKVTSTIQSASRQPRHSAPLGGPLRHPVCVQRCCKQRISVSNNSVASLICSACDIQHTPTHTHTHTHTPTETETNTHTHRNT